MTLCQICESGIAKHLCSKCGRKVCSIHYNSGLKVCSVCSEALCSFCRANLAISRCILCGKLGCNDCLIQVDNVRRVCRYCIKKYRASSKEQIIKLVGPAILARLIMQSD